jgi:hypothetical protein
VLINPVFATTTIIELALPMLPTKSPRAERRLYWAGSLVATVSAFLALFPPNWQGGLAFAGVLAGGLTFRAYMITPYIRFRGRTYAFNLSDSEPDDGSQGTTPLSDYDPAPDSYGGIATATKAWWLLAVVVIACALMVALFAVSGEGPWYAGGAATAVAIVAIGIGHQDGSWEFQIARGQLVQFAIAGVATLGAFSVLYYCAYSAGRRWPLRPTRSADYQAHPHLRKKFPN